MSRIGSISAPSRVGAAGEFQQAVRARLRRAQHRQFFRLRGDGLRQDGLGLARGFVTVADVAPVIAFFALNPLLLQRDGGASQMLRDSGDPLLVERAVVDAVRLPGCLQHAVDVIAPGLAELVERGFLLQAAVLLAEARAVFQQRAGGEEDMGVDIVAAVAGAGGMPGDISYHAARGELLSHEAAHQLPVGLGAKLTRQRHFQFARHAGVLALFDQLDAVPQRFAMTHPGGRAFGGEDLRAEHAVAAAVIVRAAAALVTQPFARAVCRGGDGAVAFGAADRAGGEVVDRHAGTRIGLPASGIAERNRDGNPLPAPGLQEHA